MRIPEVAVAPMRVQPQTTPSSQSQPHLNILIKNEESKGSFEKFEQMPKTALEEPDNSFPCLEKGGNSDITSYREPLSCSESDEDDSISSEDEELVCKGPDRNRSCYQHQQRVEVAPYSLLQGVHTYSNHFCGGTIYLNHSSQCNNFNSYQVDLQNDSEEGVYEMLQERLNIMSPDEISTVNSNLKSIFHTLDINGTPQQNDDIAAAQPSSSCQRVSPLNISPHAPTVSSAETRPHVNQGGSFQQAPISYIPVNGFKISSSTLPLDDDSDYHSASSPLSSINSPRPLSTCSVDPPSPFPDFSVNLMHNGLSMVRPIAPVSVVILEQQMSIPAESRILKQINYSQLDIEWIRVLQDDSFFQIPSSNDDTKLLQHLKNCNKTKFFFEILHSYMERIKQNSDKKQSLEYLKYHNGLGETALRVALSMQINPSLITRYIVETLIFLGDDVHQIHFNGRLLLHFLTEQGDKMALVVAELLNTKKEKDVPVFDVNKKNNLLETPLHIAAKVHFPDRLSTLALVKLLINHNASILMVDSNGMTPIHLAVKYSCDRVLLKVLLSNAMCVGSVSNVKDHLGDTAMHIAASRNDLTVKYQAQVMKQLKDSNWSLKTKNNHDKTPVSLLADERRQKVLEYINRK